MTGLAEYLENLMKVKCITIEGENAIISAAEFDWLCDQARKVEVLLRVVSAAAPEVQAKVAEGINAQTWNPGNHPVCGRCHGTNDIGHEPGAFTDALGHGPNCPDCGGKSPEPPAAAPEVQL
jgi:hypothetical protein